MLRNSLRDLFHLVKLKALDLSANSIEEVPQALSQLTLLRVLDLSNNQLVNFDVPLPKLTKLALAHNAISHLPAIFCEPDGPGLPEIREIDLSYNHLTELPDLFFSTNTQLMRLDLAHNELFEISDELHNLVNLRMLKLRNNQISLLPDSMVTITSLRMLDLTCNNIISVPEVWSNMTFLQELDFRRNKPLHEIPPSVTTNLNKANVRLSTSLPTEIIPGLYMGCLDAASNTKLLHKRGVTHIIQLLRNCDEGDAGEFSYLSIDVPDSPHVNILAYVPSTNRFITTALAQGGGVLVHCRAGISRSAAVVIAFLMYQYRFSYLEAYNYVANTRPHIHPNGGFRQQLMEYEIELANQMSQEQEDTSGADTSHLLSDSDLD